MKLSVRDLKVLSLVVAIWAIALICVGKGMDNDNNIVIKNTYSVKITTSQKSTLQQKNVDIVLKKLEIEVNTPLSINVKDYIENPEILSDLQIRQLSDTLDTSEVNISQPGTYKYSIIYKKKKKTSTITIKEKEIPNITFTLKSKVMPITGTISKNKKDYIYETLDDEIYQNMILDLREVEEHESIPGKYKYSITYKDTVYYGDYEIVEDVITSRISVSCPTDISTYDTVNKKCVCNDPNLIYDENSKTCIEQQ